jgi:hypothetical protein
MKQLMYMVIFTTSDSESAISLSYVYNTSKLIRNTNRIDAIDATHAIHAIIAENSVNVHLTIVTGYKLYQNYDETTGRNWRDQRRSNSRYMLQVHLAPAPIRSP